MIDKMALLSVLKTREAVDGGRREKLPPPAVGGCEESPPSINREETTSGGGRGGIPCAFAAMLATRDEIDDALDDQQPPHKLTDLLYCYASDRRVPGSYREAMTSEHAHLWEDSTGREFYGLLDAGTFEPV